MRRLDGGAPLRAAMKRAGLTVASLAAETKRVDPEGIGISHSLIGFLVSQGKSAREETTDLSAELLAKALGEPLEHFFDTGVPSSVPAQSTSTARRRIQGQRSKSSLPAPLMTQRELCAYLRKSPTWIDEQIKNDADFPMYRIGRSRRFEGERVRDYVDAQARKTQQRVA